jgi:hypothetical protein
MRVESSLLAAFEGMPKMEVPAATAGNKPRIFELRTYESHSKKANKKKIEMFNKGEIAIFRRTGLQPVFFGETLIGTKMPNLTYLLVFEHGRAGEPLGRVRLGSGMEKVERHTGLHRRRDRQQHQQCFPAANRLFTDLIQNRAVKPQFQILKSW